MSAIVLKFPQPKVKGTVLKGPNKDRLYFCTQCKSELFRIDLDGEVWCRCGAWIKNLKAELV